MRYSRCKRVFKWFYRIVWALATVSAVAYGAALHVDSEWVLKQVPPFRWSVNFLKNTAWLVLPPATVALAILDAIKDRLSPEPIEVAVKSLLDDFRKNAFPDEDSDIDHRVTLFRYNGNFLRPFQRSGAFTQRSSVKFKVPPDTPEQFEGFAGLVYTSGSITYIYDLPDMSRSKPNIRVYSQRTHVPKEWVEARLKKKKRFPRSLWGTPIEVNGRKWGVVVVDSVQERIPGEADLKENFTSVGTCLSALLRGGK